MWVIESMAVRLLTNSKAAVWGGGEGAMRVTGGTPGLAHIRESTSSSP